MDLDWRYERKFAIEQMSLNEAENILLCNNMFFSEVYYKRQVNNIYLDSIYMDAYYTNVEGLGHRKKYRVRWYGNLFSKIRRPVLEVKVKNGIVGSKYKYKLHEFELSRLFRTKTLEQVFGKSNLPEDVNLELSTVDPTLINTYSRKYYMSANGKYRVTIDTGLEYFSVQRGFNNIVAGSLQRGIVIEIKYSVENDENIDRITQLFPFRLTRSSKYVQGVSRSTGLYY